MRTNDKDFRSPFKWGVDVILITLGVTVLFVAVLIPMLTSEASSQVLKYALASVLILTILFGILLCPLYVSVNGTRIRIRRVTSSVNIPVSEITSVAQISRKDMKGTIRTFGSGGYFGYLGRFRNDKYGNFRMYATEMKNLVLIRTKGRSYILSCCDVAGFIEALNMSKR